MEVQTVIICVTWDDCALVVIACEVVADTRSCAAG